MRGESGGARVVGCYSNRPSCRFPRLQGRPGALDLGACRCTQYVAVSGSRCWWLHLQLLRLEVLRYLSECLPYYLTTLLGRNLGTCHGEEGARQRRVPR